MPSIQAFISGAWRTSGRAEYLIGGTWRRVTRGESYINGAWRSVASFVPPLSLSATGSVRGQRRTNTPSSAYIETNFATATPSGGAAPYSYSWQIIEGDADISAANMAVTKFGNNVPPNTALDARARVTCTDALGSTATAETQITLINDAGGL